MGHDADETLMKAIAEAGGGAYGRGLDLNLLTQATLDVFAFTGDDEDDED